MINKYLLIFLVGVSFNLNALGAEVMAILANPDLAPYSSERMPGGGLIVKMAAEALKQKKISYKIVWLPWKRAFDEVKNGYYMAGFPTPLTAKTKEEVLVSEPLFKLDEVLFALESAKLNSKDDSGYLKKTICRPKDWAENPEVDAFISKYDLKVEHGKGAIGCIKMMFNKRVDFFVSDEIQASIAINDVINENRELYKSFPQIVSLGKKVSTTYLYMIAPKNNEKAKNFIKLINEQFNKFNKDGTIKKIIQNYKG